MDNLSENLFQAIDTIIAARINNLPYDFTKQCKIINIDEADKGIYRVDDGAASFEAYGEANAYQIDDVVRVSVPEGKMELDKFIVGKWLTRDDDIISSKSALESVIDLTGNIYKGNALSQLDYDCSLYNSVILTADITSTNMTEEYGINITINGDQENKTVLKLHSSHMIGDPANFNIPSPQEAVFILDAKTLPVIQSIEIGYENAKNNEGEAQPWKADNIHLALGNDSTHLDKTVKIFTSDKLTYTYKDDKPERTLSLLWYNQDDTGKYIGYSDGEYDTSDVNDKGQYIYDEISDAEQKANRYCIRWYKKDIMGTGDALIEKGWTFIEDSLNVGLPTPQENETMTLPKNGNREFKVKLNTLGTTTETYVAILVYNHIKYRSNEIVFTNEVAGNLNEAISNGISNFKLQHGTNSKSLYDIYDFNTGKSLPGVTLTGKQLQVQWNKELEGGTIKWIVPESDTQLIIDENVEEPKTITNENSLVLNYSLSDTYNMANTNNTVYCEVRPQNSNIIYKAEQTFIFQPRGNNGTPYTFIAIPQGHSISAIVQEENSDDYKLSLLLQLSDENDNDISTNLTNTNTKAEWMWQEHYPSSKGASTEFDSNHIIITNTWGVLAITTTAIGKGTPLTIYCSIGVLDNNWINIKEKIKGPIRVNYSAQGILTNISNPYEKTFDDIQIVFSEGYKDFVKLQDNTLVVSPIYLQDMTTAPCYLKLNYDWLQPIVFIQERYGSSLLNNWDNTLTLDQDNNFIASAAMAAGSKENNNTFTGVVMGKIQENDKPLQGLFGYNSGSQTFGFKIDGTGFIGGNNGGRIEFDGTRATIDMGKYVHLNGLPDPDENYLLVGTDDNYLKFSADDKLSIQVNEFILNAWQDTEGIYLNSNPHNNEYYFKVGDENNYLSFNKEKDFELKVNKLTLSAGSGSEIFYLSNYENSDNKRLIIGSNFSVDVQGNITANGGSLGGININETGIGIPMVEKSMSSSFHATMVFKKGVTEDGAVGTTTVGNYNDETKWHNDVYKIEQGWKTIYFTNYPSNTEIFIMNTIPTQNDSKDTYFHGTCAAYTEGLDVSNYVGKFLIVNHKGSLHPIISQQQSSFRIEAATGNIVAKNAILQGELNVSHLKALVGKMSEWSFEDEYFGRSEISMAPVVNINGFSNYGLKIDNQTAVPNIMYLTLKDDGGPCIIYSNGTERTTKYLDLSTLGTWKEV